MIDLPFALPTAVAGIALWRCTPRAVCSAGGSVGFPASRPASGLRTGMARVADRADGVRQISLAPLGVVIAMAFVRLLAVRRAQWVQPDVIEDHRAGRQRRRRRRFRRRPVCRSSALSSCPKRAPALTSQEFTMALARGLGE